MSTRPTPLARPAVLLLTPLLALFLGLAAAPAAADGFTRSLPAEPGGRLLVVLERGTLELARHESPDGGAVRVEVECRGFGAADVDFDLVRRDGDWILVGREADWLRWVAVGPRVTVRAFVPRGFDAELSDPVASAAALAGGPRARHTY